MLKQLLSSRLITVTLKSLPFTTAGHMQLVHLQSNIVSAWMKYCQKLTSLNNLTTSNTSLTVVVSWAMYMHTWRFWVYFQADAMNKRACFRSHIHNYIVMYVFLPQCWRLRLSMLIHTRPDPHRDGILLIPNPEPSAQQAAWMKT